MFTSRYVRPVLAISVVLLALLAFAGTAGAAGYNNDAGLTSSKSSVAPGGDVVLTGKGFKANSDVAIELHSDPVSLGSATTDGSGVFTKTVTIPADTSAGAHTFYAIGVAPDGSPLTLTTPITVTGASSSPLAFTGSNIILPVLGVGVIALAIGLGLRRSAKRRA